MSDQNENSNSNIIKVFGDKAAYKPTGIIEVFIANDDGIHTKVGEFVDGVNVVGGMPSVPGLLNGQETQAGGEPAQSYSGRIDLDFNSDTFGMFDPRFGFQNTRFPHILFNNEVTSLGTYQGVNSNASDIIKYNAILNHPNTMQEVNLQLIQLKAWADYNNVDQDEVLKKLKSNSSIIGQKYETILNKDNLNTDEVINEKNDLINSRSTSGITTDSGIAEVLLNDEAFTDKEGVDTQSLEDFNANVNQIEGGLDQYEALLNNFDDAPEQFKESFGVFGGGILSLKYPHDAVYGGGGVAGQDHIVIEQFQYSAPQEQFMVRGERRQSTDFLGGLRRNPVTKEFIGVCRMPIPNNLSFSNGVSWGDGRINAVEAAAFFTAFGGIDKTISSGNIVDGIGTVGSDIGAFLNKVRGGDLGKGSSAGALLSAFASQFALGRIGINVDANQFIQRGLGQAINPNLELLFNGPKLRNFTFSFNFAPNDELDASVMRKIQRFFKQGMAPKRDNENLIFLGSPNVFRLRYRTKQKDRIKGLPMHKICALTTCEINYAPDNVYQSYDDSKAGSSPIRTVMNLNFTELTPVFANDYLSEFEQQSNESGNGTFFSDEFGQDEGEGAFRPITTEDTGF